MSGRRLDAYAAVAGAKNCAILVEDIDEYYRSWQKLMSMGVRRIFPAHGGPFDAANLGENMGKIKRGDLIPVD